MCWRRSAADCSPFARSWRCMKITLDGYLAGHRAARWVLAEHCAGNQCRIVSSKYPGNWIPQVL
jgi:hypothetical protein